MKRTRLLAATAAILVLSAPAFAGNLVKQSRAVVTIYVTMQPWDLSQPWTKQSVRNVSCSGFRIKQGILTNGHCLADATFIEAQLAGGADKIEAELVAVNHQIDLALIRLKDARLMDSLPMVEFGDLPEPREKVVTVGYPTGGKQLSFTEGIVSRVDIMTYSHSGMPSLMVQTDAAINPGNSGGPVFADASGDCLGVATQKNTGGEGLGYFIPTPVIGQFLKDIEDGTVEGIPALGVSMQTLENPALRRALGMKAEQSGVRIKEVATGSSAYGLLTTDDVLLEIEGQQIFNDGRVPFRQRDKIGLGYYVYSRLVGETARVNVLRSGSIVDVPIPLKPYLFSVIPDLPAYDRPPRYDYYGGFVFMAVEPRYLWRWGGRAASGMPDGIRPYMDMPIGTENLQELVVISQIYNASFNKGYAGQVENTRVESVNGVAITSLAAFSEALRKAQPDGFVRIGLEDGDDIVLDTTEVAAEDAALKERYGIK